MSIPRIETTELVATIKVYAKTPVCTLCGNISLDADIYAQTKEVICRQCAKVTDNVKALVALEATDVASFEQIEAVLEPK